MASETRESERESAVGLAEGGAVQLGRGSAFRVAAGRPLTSALGVQQLPLGTSDSHAAAVAVASDSAAIVVRRGGRERWEVFPRQGNASPAVAVDWRSDWLAVAFRDGTVGLFLPPDTTPLALWEVPGPLIHLAWSPSRPAVLYVAGPKTLWVWDLLQDMHAPILTESLNSREGNLQTFCLGYPYY